MLQRLPIPLRIKSKQPTRPIGDCPSSERPSLSPLLPLSSPATLAFPAVPATFTAALPQGLCTCHPSAWNLFPWVSACLAPSLLQVSAPMRFPGAGGAGFPDGFYQNHTRPQTIISIYLLPSLYHHLTDRICTWLLGYCLCPCP